VFGRLGVAGAISIDGPAVRVFPDAAREDCILGEVARQISRELGAGAACHPFGVTARISTVFGAFALIRALIAPSTRVPGRHQVSRRSRRGVPH
jgi:hypothetical protein